MIRIWERKIFWTSNSRRGIIPRVGMGLCMPSKLIALRKHGLLALPRKHGIVALWGNFRGLKKSTKTWTSRTPEAFSSKKTWDYRTLSTKTWKTCHKSKISRRFGEVKGYLISGQSRL